MFVFQTDTGFGKILFGNSLSSFFQTERIGNFYHDYRESEMLAGGTFKKVISCLSVCLSIF